MITSMTLRNFKCFPIAEVPMAPLTVLAGSNGSGKSSVAQALLLVLQSEYSGALHKGELQLNGELVQLGSAQELLYRRSDSDILSITLRSKVDTQLFAASVRSDDVSRSLILHASLTTRTTLRPTRLFYLSADRLGPQTAYPLVMAQDRANTIGTRGEFAPHLFLNARSSVIDNPLLLLENADKRLFPQLEHQFALWMDRLFPGFSYDAGTVTQLDLVRLGFSLHSQVGQGTFQRPSNVGFGVSVVLPIVVAGLLAAPGDLVVIENPETHLHPSAQSIIGEFLARVAAGGVQVLIETHSDHVVNGIRVAFKNDVVSASDLSFLAFSKARTFGSHSIVAIRLGDDGAFTDHPPEFFDQLDKDLEIILGP